MDEKKYIFIDRYIYDRCSVLNVKSLIKILSFLKRY